MEFESRSRIQSRLDMAPLIDVVFLLLIFFMLTSTFLTPEAIDLELPGSTSAQKSEETPLTVVISASGEILLNGEILPIEKLQAAVQPILTDNPEQNITLKSDAGVSVQELLRVMDVLRTAGGRNIALATQPVP